MTHQALLQLLADMTLEEKAMQLCQLPGGVYNPEAAVTGISRYQVDPRIKQLAGSTLGVGLGKKGSGVIRKIQEEYMENHPHHIPLLFMADIIHGHRTVFPCPLGQGATFDPELSRQSAAVQAEEAGLDGIHVTFSPMADLSRDARWGRVMESTGEDKLLNSRMAAAMVRGYQGNDLRDGHSMASCVKHFAAYGAADAGRDYNNTELSEHTLREYFLPAYESAIRAGAKLVMSSFNSWNGIPVTGHQWLMKKVLREEMGFAGVTISDWDAVGQLVPHGYAADKRDAALKAMQAGVDIDMCTCAYAEYLQALAQSGEIDEKQLDEAVLRVLTLKNELGLFENPFRGLADAPRFTDADKRALARKAVAESLVLLKNEGEALPLSGKRVAFIGPYAQSEELISSWALAGEKEHTVSLWEAAQGAFTQGETQIRTAPGCTMLDNDTELSRGHYQADDWDAQNEALLRDAAEAAAWADTVVLCLGEHHLQSGESTSRVFLRLPQVQLRLLHAVAAACDRVVTLVFCGRPLELQQASRLSQALMVCWLPGTEGGNGIMDVLTGKVPPSGSLPMSFPYAVGQEPLHYDSYPTGRPKPASGWAGFTSRYLDCPNEALYPFGFGLSYGNLSVSPVTMSASELTADGKLTASVTLKNTGDLPAARTVQLYIRDLTGSRVRPVRELKDFRRVALAPGEETAVSFTVDEPMLRFWRGDDTFGSEPGAFRLWISLDSMSGEPAEFALNA